MTDRICWHGHRVTDPEATQCPLCGVTMDTARLATAETHARQTQGAGPLRSVNWLSGGVFLMIIGSVLWLRAGSDGAQVAGLILTQIGGVAALIGVIGLGVYNGMLDLGERRQSDQSKDDS